MRNWVYYMQQGLKSMWKKKEVPELRVVDDAGVDIKTGKYVGDNNYIRPPHYLKGKVFEPIDYKECGCLPDCGCKETKEDNLKG